MPLALIGISHDGGSLERGSAEAPKFVRKYAYRVESYSPIFHKDISMAYFKDWGDFSLEEVIKLPKRFDQALFIGGDHSITPKLVRWLRPEAVVHIDAHMDFKEVFGKRDSHACAMKRVAEIIGGEHIYHFGVRSWSEEERRREAYNRPLEALRHLHLPYSNVYLSIDIDVLDPAYAPGVATPEPFGERPRELLRTVVDFILSSGSVKYVDVVEYNPLIEERTTGVLMASLVRELLLALHTSRNNSL